VVFQGGNVNIRDSMITRSTEIIAEEMGDIERMRRRRMYEEMTNEDEDEESIISSEYVLI